METTMARSATGRHRTGIGADMSACYIIWRNKHAQDEHLCEVVNRVNVA